MRRGTIYDVLKLLVIQCSILILSIYPTVLSVLESNLNPLSNYVVILTCMTQ